MRRASTAALLILPAILAGCWPFWTGDDGTYHDWCTCWSTSETTCSGFDELGLCEDGCSFTYHDCDVMCTEGGFAGSAGCGWDTDFAQDVCWCTDDAPTCDCTGDETECWSEGFLMSCDDGCTWSTYDCQDLCVASGYDLATGCGYDSSLGDEGCFCDDEPVCDCGPGQLACWDDWSIASCDDGCTWYVYDCLDLCVESGWDSTTGCGYDYGTYEDACFCDSY